MWLVKEKSLFYIRFGYYGPKQLVGLIVIYKAYLNDSDLYFSQPLKPSWD